MKTKLPQLLVSIVLAALFVPFLQQTFSVFSERPLYGLQGKPVPAPAISAKSWLQGSYQDSCYAWRKSNFGFRNFFVRLNNQLAYSCWNKARANQLIIGKNNCLMVRSGIDAFFGNDFAGDDSIRKKIRLLKTVQDQLERRGTSLLVVVVPDKSAAYPEYIPDLFPREFKRTNLQAYSEISKQEGLNFLNLVPYIDTLCRQKHYPLYPMYGFHWSEYGMLFALDSITHAIESLRHIDMPDLDITGNEWTDSLHYTDDDLLKGMNLLCDFPKVRMAYPFYQYRQENKIRPSLLTVADSYWWNEFVSPADAALFSRSDFWFYFNEFHQHGQEMQPFSQVNLLEQLNRHDVVVLLCSDFNLPRFGWGFPQAASTALRQADPFFEKEVQAAMERIRNDAGWSASVREKARQKGIAFEEMLRIDAEYVVREDRKKSISK